MSKVPRLSQKFQPKLVSVKLSDTLFAAVREELTRKALVDAQRCFGYFPALKGSKGIDTNLPQCKNFSLDNPEIKLEGKKLEFNFLRLSLIKQEGNAPFHLDTDSATALTGNIGTISDRLVWRLLLNLSGETPRTLGYLDCEALAAPLVAEGGYLHCPDKALTKERLRSINIAPRSKGTIHGVLFCASRVLHSGRDDEHGHFVAGYGCEEEA